MTIPRFRFTNGEDANACLREFANRFVKAGSRDRWVHILCERPDKARGELHKFDRQLVAGVCRALSEPDARPENLLWLLGDVPGFFFDGQGPAKMTSLRCVLDDMSPYQDDGLFSMNNGTRALFFHHDGAVWICG